ncbi:MAG TPA: hypothetical protein PLU33_08510 [Treponemataceae bacterium]|nr:hypothetical protein [Treponemataceae bacterium]
MHRKLISVWFILFIILISVHADYSRWLTGQVSAGTSAVIYGDKDFRTFNKYLLSNDYKRFMFTVDASGGIILDEHVRFSFGSLLNYDSFVKSRFNAVYLDYNFYTGIRIYPELRGFNFGIDYVVGRRSNVLKLPLFDSDTSLTDSALDGSVTEDPADIVPHTPWGNGFRFTAEYDFMYDSTGLAPMVGVSWRCMPRGTFYDNIFSVFFKMLFR